MIPDAQLEVRRIVEQELADLHGMWQGAAAREHNVFLKAISPQLAIGSKLSRQLTSRLGSKLARIARGLAEVRYGTEKVPRHLSQRGVEAPPTAQRSDDTFVYSCFEKDRVVELTLQLVTQAKAVSKIGTEQWRELYEQALDELWTGPQGNPWFVQVDLCVLDGQVGFAELESGGMLDSSNAIGQTRKLVQAGLASGDRELPLHFCTAYANYGEGRGIKGSLRSYFEQEPDHRDGLLTGSNWWNRILPEPLIFSDFLDIFHEVAEEYEIAGPTD